MAAREPDEAGPGAGVKGVVLTERGQLRDTFWRRLVGEDGPLGQLSGDELAQLRTILRSALAGPPT